jgi:magnesium chelatase family protein
LIATAESVALVGMDGYRVRVEVSVNAGLPNFTIVGLPDASVQEARERVRAAMHAAGEPWPQQRITANLSPANVRKSGSSFDLALALALASTQGRISAERLREICVLGELGLDGSVRRVRGILPAAIAAAEDGMKRLLVPAGNAREAALVAGIDAFGVTDLAQAVRFMRGECQLDPAITGDGTVALPEADLDLSDVRGNVTAKRALEIAAAGGHNLLMVGAPGGGKTMLARRLPTILPPMTDAESLEVTKVHSVAGLLPADGGLIVSRPFRAPHHTSSTAGMIGGGSPLPHPGEISLAHRGVLFLDEYGEFRNESLQALRQPLEDGIVRIVRSRWAVTYPARFQLVAASNPCPCGFQGDERKGCVCTTGRLSSYRQRLKGPIVDRIDMQVTVARLTKRQLFGAPEGDPSCVVSARVREARDVQAARLGMFGLTCNAEVPPRDLADVCLLTVEARRLIGDAVEKFPMSARGAHRTIRVARTIADLNGEEAVDANATREALQYRLSDKNDDSSRHE